MDKLDQQAAEIVKLTACASPTFWIEERCVLLRELYVGIPAKELCKKLGCTRKALYNQANRLGLHKIARNHD